MAKHCIITGSFDFLESDYMFQKLQVNKAKNTQIARFLENTNSRHSIKEMQQDL